MFQSTSGLLNKKQCNQNVYLQAFVKKSLFRAFNDCTKDSATIIGVKARSQPYLRTRVRNASLKTQYDLQLILKSISDTISQKEIKHSRIFRSKVDPLFGVRIVKF